ncbi:fungal class II heme-containing peroxidase [Taxawa tesnikishii (nom. ined.)]|nr:fungal class II heme-containing peroxidase [Dothideales sp. JES 119]
MHLSQSIALLATVAGASAFSLQDISSFAHDLRLPSIPLLKRFGGPPGQQGPPSQPSGGSSSGGSCPAVWSTISTELTSMFLSNGQCNDDARAAIRASFHDCASWDQSEGEHGGCDGSLILAKEYEAKENAGLQGIALKLSDLANKHNVGVADIIAFAGSHATATCPLGPRVQTFVGRKDSSTPNDLSKLPDVHSPGDALYALFQAKGFDAGELAALMGAHSTSRQFTTDPSRAGAAQDDTPGVWDVKYYQQTIDGSAPFVLESDRNLANQAQVGPAFKSFVGAQGRWGIAYSRAMAKMQLLGVPGGSSNLIDCTSALPRGTFGRDVRAAPIDERLR